MLTDMTTVRNSRARYSGADDKKHIRLGTLKQGPAGPLRVGRLPSGKIFFGAPSFVVAFGRSATLGKSRGEALIFTDE